METKPGGRVPKERSVWGSNLERSISRLSSAKAATHFVTEVPIGLWAMQRGLGNAFTTLHRNTLEGLCVFILSHEVSLMS